MERGIIRKQCKMLLVLVFIIISSFSISKEVKGADDPMSTAIPVTFGVSQSGAINEQQEAAYYQFTLPTAGRITIDTTAHMKYMWFKIYDSNKEAIYSTYFSWNSTSELIVEKYTFDLLAGTYYYVIEDYNYYYGNYNFIISYTSANETFLEYCNVQNEGLTTANIVETNGTIYNGQLAYNETDDYFKFTLSSSGYIDFNSQLFIKETYLYLYDENGNELWRKYSSWNSTSEVSVIENSLNLTKGTYYLRYKKYDNYKSGNYQFSLNFTSANESFEEINGGSNNSLAEASLIEFNVIYNGQLAQNDDKDFYKFIVSSEQNLEVNVNSDIKYLDIFIYDSKGIEIADWDPYWNDITKKLEYTNRSLTVQPGTYYIVIAQDSWESWVGPYTLNIGEYFKVEKVKLNATKKVLTQGKTFTLKKTITPSNATDRTVLWSSSNSSVATVNEKGKVKTLKPGVSTITAVSSDNKNIMESCVIIVKPKKAVTISSLKKYSNSYYGYKGFQISYKQISGVNGYQISYAKNKKFNKAISKFVSSSYGGDTITNLSKGTYYVRVRSYVENNGTKYYGSWSIVKSIKVK